MTSPEIGTQTDISTTFLEWFERNKRYATVVAAVVVVGAGAYWLVQRSRADRVVAASTGLDQAKQSMNVNNLPLAQSDLQRLVQGYGSTAPGAQGAMLLAQMYYDQGRFGDGIKSLQDELGEAPSPIKGELQDLIGDGYLAWSKPADAAGAYEQSAAETSLVGEKSNERIKAARAYGVANDSAKAIAIWKDLANTSKSSGVAAEARVRLGELTAKPVGKS